MEISNELRKLKERLELMKKSNSFAPFPVYDTEDINDVQNLINTMKKIEYDDLPVAACKYCNSLHILNDDLENDICAKCGAVNEIKVFNNINEYLYEREQKEKETED